MFQCLYKCGSSAPSTQEYHIYPRSASILDLRLEKGIVCDNCNEYFGNNLENNFVHTHPLTSGRITSKTKTRKGKTPKLFFKNGHVFTREDHADKCIYNIPIEPDIHIEEKDNGDLAFTSYYQPPDFDALTISRVLCKMAIESLFSPEQKTFDPFDKGFDSIKKYVRFGPTRELKFVWFAWKKMPFDGGLPKLKLLYNNIKNIIGMLVELYFPKGMYLVPLHPINRITMSPATRNEWNVVDKPGVFEAEKEFVVQNLIKVQPK